MTNRQEQQMGAVKNIFGAIPPPPPPPLFNRSRSPTQLSNGANGYQNHKRSGNLVSLDTTNYQNLGVPNFQNLGALADNISIAIIAFIYLLKYLCLCLCIFVYVCLSV
jgi:hypothetical protein